DNPKGNADTERVIRTLKEDLVWTREWTSPYAFREELVAWINRYNQDYPHSSLGYMTPVEFEQKEIKQSPLTRTLNSPLFCS
ncbi:MAG TPA: integrase core domain-containing protein, partial [bacterium]|nr:integrase core domain-containing protein [bacterium]